MKPTPPLACRGHDPHPGRLEQVPLPGAVAPLPDLAGCDGFLLFLLHEHFLVCAACCVKPSIHPGIPQGSRATVAHECPALRMVICLMFSYVPTSLDRGFDCPAVETIYQRFRTVKFGERKITLLAFECRNHPFPVVFFSRCSLRRIYFAKLSSIHILSRRILTNASSSRVSNSRRM